MRWMTRLRTSKIVLYDISVATGERSCLRTLNGTQGGITKLLNDARLDMILLKGILDNLNWALASRFPKRVSFSYVNPGIMGFSVLTGQYAYRTSMIRVLGMATM